MAMEIIGQHKQSHGTSPNTAVAQEIIRLQLLAEAVARSTGVHPRQQNLHPHPAVATILVVMTAAKSGHMKDSQASTSPIRMRLLGHYMMKQMQMIPPLKLRTHITGMSLLHCKPSVGVRL